MAKSASYMQAYRAKRVAVSNAAVAAAAQTPQQVQQAQQMAQALLDTGAIATPEQVRAMSDKEIVNFINNAKQTDMPAFMADADTQRFIYAGGFNDMPTLVDSTQFNKLDGTTIYRTVNPAYDSKTDVGMTAQQVADQTMRGSLSRIGGGIYGDGYYFTNDLQASRSGYGGPSMKTMQMKIKSDAKLVDHSQLSNMFKAESPKVKKAFNSMSEIRYDGLMSAYALWKGYDGIIIGGSQSSKGNHKTIGGYDTYVNVINRGVMVFNSDTI